MGDIIVGVDESEGAAWALQWAAREGELRGWTVTAVMAWGYLDQHRAFGTEHFVPEYNDDDAAEALAAIADRTLGGGRGRVGTRVECDLPSPVLLEAAKNADLLVIGSRGLGGFKGLLLGSVSLRCLHYATCPVAVIRRAPDMMRHEERLVVAIDGSEDAQRALDWALDEARLRSARLTVMNVWRTPYVGGYPYTGAEFEPAQFEHASQQLIAAAVERADTTRLTAPVDPVSVRGEAAGAILETAATADLIVLGSRGLGRFKGALLGSVSTQVSQHAETAVVIVPGDL